MKDELDKIKTALVIAIQTVDKLRAQGAYQEALALMHGEVFPLYARFGDDTAMGALWSRVANLTWLLDQQQKGDEALTIYIDKALPAARAVGDLFTVARALFDCAGIRLVQDLGMESVLLAKAELEESYALCKQMEDAEGIATVGSDLGRIQIYLGEREEGMAKLRESVTLYLEKGLIEEAERIQGIINEEAPGRTNPDELITLN